MKILMTGVTCFSGYWFARQLILDGNELICFRAKSNKDSIDLNVWLEKLNTEELPFRVQTVDSKFLDRENIDLLLLHGSSMRNRRSRNFDVDSAVKETVVISEFIQQHFNVKCVVHTGTFSERDEGVGESPRIAFNPYSESKSRIYEAHCDLFSDQPLLKYVMPNPFGIFQKDNMFSYLESKWRENLQPSIANPYYIRDYVPIDLLSQNYANVVCKFAKGEFNEKKYSPSFYAMTNKEVVSLYAQKVYENTKIQYTFSTNEQLNFEEPRVRVNLNVATEYAVEWSEVNFWKNLTNKFLGGD